jgi:serine/threonine-protein kinase
MPPRPTPIGQLPPTMSDLRLTEASAGGLLSGRFGLVIGFMAGMLITAVVVAVYLFVLR